MSGCAPRAREDIVRPPRLIGASGRPLNFTVRSHFGEIQRREELGRCFGWLCGVRTVADSVVLRASSFGASDVRVWPPRLRWASGRVPVASVRQRSTSRQAASLIASMGTLNAEAFFACDAQAARAQWWL